MVKNLTSNQILLIAMSTVLLLLAALSFYLLQDPYAPLPFGPAEPTGTPSPLPPTPSYIVPPSATSSPTRRTSYTPFAPHGTPTSLTPQATEAPPPTAVLTPPGSPSPNVTANTPTRTPPGTQTLTPAPGTTIPASTQVTNTRTPTLTSTSATTTLTPTVTPTLEQGEFVVTGRILQNGTPVPNVVVWFKDDVDPRQGTTDQGGHYSFVTLAPGTQFTLKFYQRDNPQLTPADEITSLAWIEGTLPTGVDTIQLPDFEVSLNLNQMLFELVSPVDGATYSAAFISPSNPIQFVWSLYALGGSYHVELGPNSSDTPIWSTSQLAATNTMWNGTLNNGDHITEGAYWWRVAVTDSLGNYVLNLFTPAWDILFNP